MSDERDERQVKIIGETGAVTGFDTPDRKDAHATQYTTTPEGSRVGSSDGSTYQPVDMPDPKEVTGQFDHLATRDSEAMEHKLQRPEYEGAVSNANLGLDAAALDALTPTGDLNTTGSLTVAAERRERAIDPNPNYTPASNKAPAHMPERRPDLGNPAMPDAVVERGERDLNEK